MLTETEFIELVEAITKPVTLEQLNTMTPLEARQYNNAEAYRAGRALLAFYEKKRKQHAS